ncbi:MULTISPECIES: hypothetical protein [Phenylobacterium]|uniref:Uncharacterized protein n=1 Tax=Phenylobacterium koreense TaxID=266125 RepID=A0ABV2EIT4_9CAUL
MSGKHRHPEGGDQPQLDKFKDLARELEADEDEARFEEAVLKIALKAPPEDDD